MLITSRLGQLWVPRGPEHGCCLPRSKDWFFPVVAFPGRTLRPIDGSGRLQRERRDQKRDGLPPALEDLGFTGSHPLEQAGARCADRGWRPSSSCCTFRHIRRTVKGFPHLPADRSAGFFRVQATIAAEYGEDKPRIPRISRMKSGVNPSSGRDSSRVRRAAPPPRGSIGTGRDCHRCR